jgi:hypothetical protein
MLRKINQEWCRQHNQPEYCVQHKMEADPQKPDRSEFIVGEEAVQDRGGAYDHQEPPARPLNVEDEG